MVLVVFCPNMGLTYVSTIWYSDFFSATVPNETDSFRKGRAAWHDNVIFLESFWDINVQIGSDFSVLIIWCD